ncbi:hypothetical protein [Antrihabitans sp. YC2-6]|uniref:hypothetical protein n=1 Tax=Antrihabitans sp. YC2-6 TaxID=2799498 RepID=UPI0018F5BDF1|nr:hypothetical protein [Antrihabitans sp. YC2-6]MBJ8346876.1 hypothetical protein [Antrihabitans sp. YC2-6]
MSTTTATVDRPDEASAVRRVIEHAVLALTMRWLFLLVCVMIAFLHTWERVVDEAAAGTVIGYIFVLPLLAGIAAQGIARRRSGELPIHDRQIDTIVGGLGLIVTIAIEGLWLRRYEDQYSLFHLDILAALVFSASGAILLFGLRPVARFWSVWLLLLALNPLVYRMVAIEMGGSRFDYGLVLVLLAGVAGGIAVARTKRRAVWGFVCTVVIGVGCLWLLQAFWPNAHVLVVQLVPSVTAAIATGTAFFLFRRRGEAKSPLGRTVLPTTARTVVRSGLALACATVVLFFLPLPPVVPEVTTKGPPGSAAEPLSAPSGWEQVGIEDYEWVRSFFGRDATLVRQTVLADTGNPDWDARARPRRLVVDTLTTTNAATLGLYPEATLYRLANTRTSRTLELRLGHGVTGSLYTSVNDDLLLTWTKLVFTWVRDDATQRVTVISVDNHEPDAQFPVAAPSMASNLGTSIGVFLRGNHIASNENPDYKDLALLTDFGTRLVSAQFLRAGYAS